MGKLIPFPAHWKYRDWWAGKFIVRRIEYSVLFLWERHFLNCAKFWKCDWHWEDPHPTSFSWLSEVTSYKFSFLSCLLLTWVFSFLRGRRGAFSPLLSSWVEDTREITDLAPFPGSLECCSRSLTATYLLHAALCLLPEWRESLLHHLW